jgi:hypothetical protein
MKLDLGLSQTIIAQRRLFAKTVDAEDVSFLFQDQKHDPSASIHPHNGFFFLGIQME